MWVLLLGAALASDVAFLGFSPSGRFAAWETAYEDHGVWVVELRSLDVPAGAWAHWPVASRGATREEAAGRARAQAAEQLRLQRVDAEVAGAPAPYWTELIGDAAGTARVRVRTAAGVGVLETSAAPSGEDCPLPAVRPSWRWTQPGGATLDLLRLSAPLRVPPCVVAYDLVEAREGPHGALILLFRAWVATGGDDVVARHVPASVLVR